MTHRELGEYIRHASVRPNLLHKAVHRQKVFKRAEQYRFEEIIIGEPKPIDLSHEELQTAAGTRIVGVPVSRGRVRGRAFVIESIEQAGQVQEGDILVARMTDIGWTPLFACIGGLVTELGAMFSHGATIAREYNLPCVVRCINATRIIRTGDIVIVDGTAGYIEKIT